MNRDTRIKYPRTPHLPSSPGATKDDKKMSRGDASELFSRGTVVTEKMDGGNVTLARDYFHARSTTSDITPMWERHAKSEWAKIAHEIPEGWRVSCESLWAQRSVPYKDLPAFLMVIGIWDGSNNLLNWSQTEEWASLLGLPTVPVLGTGFTDEITALGLWTARCDIRTSEGFVVRSSHAIPYARFGRFVGKWVRANHVQTPACWRYGNNFITNRLAMR